MPDFMPIERIRELPWTRKNYRPGPKGEQFGYDTAEGYSSREIGIPRTVQNYVRVRPGLIVPEHFHTKTDEFFLSRVC